MEQFALIASSTIGWLHRIRRGERDRERNRRENIEKAMQVAAKKKQYEWGRYTFVDLFCVNNCHVLFGLI